MLEIQRIREKKQELADKLMKVRKADYSTELEKAFHIDEEKRKSFFSQTASIRQIGGEVHSRSIEKKEFLDHKNEFYDALIMQRKYWEKRGFMYKSDDFFGYKLG